MLELCTQLQGELLVIFIERPDAIWENPVVPGVLPTFVVNLEPVTVSRLLTDLDIHNFGLVEHIHVEAKDFFILAEGRRRRLLARGSHDENSTRLTRLLNYGLLEKSVNRADRINKDAMGIYVRGVSGAKSMLLCCLVKL